MRTVYLLAWLGIGTMAGVTLAQDPTPAPTQPAPAGQVSAGAAVDPGLCSCQAGRDGAGLWAETDFLVYWLKPVCVTVPTVGTAVPGQPGLQLAQGPHKFEFDGADGVRPRIGAWLTGDSFLGVECEGFVLEQKAAGSPVVTANGSPATFILFQNPDNTNGTLPLSIPGVVNATSSAVASSQLWGLETNLALHWTAERGACVLHFTGLAGCRYLHLVDRDLLTNRQSLVSDPSVAAVGQADFTTRNQFVGGQLGSRLGIARGPLQLDVTTKLAFGETHLVSEVSGGRCCRARVFFPRSCRGRSWRFPATWAGRRRIGSRWCPSSTCGCAGRPAITSS
jgi:hypothetical protein